MYRYIIKLVLHNGDIETIMASGKHDNFYACALDESCEINDIIMKRDDFEYYDYERIY